MAIILWFIILDSKSFLDKEIKNPKKVRANIITSIILILIGLDSMAELLFNNQLDSISSTMIILVGFTGSGLYLLIFTLRAKSIIEENSTNKEVNLSNEEMDLK